MPMSDAEGVFLRLKSVTKKYGRKSRGVQNLSFELKKGEKVGLLGLNGAGKSTTFRLIAGLLKPDVGQIDFCDSPSRAEQTLGMLGYLPEHASLPLELRVEKYIRLEAELRGVSPALRFDELVEACELQEVLGKRIKALSRGYRKRVALAGALIHGPSLLLLDEPTAGLDPHQVGQFRRLIDKVSKDCAVLISTHVLAEVEAICRRCLILHEGQLKADLAIPIEQKGLYEAELKGVVKGDVHGAELLGERDGWARVRLVPEPSPEEWLRYIMSVGECRSLVPCIEKLEDHFLSLTQALHLED
jgi:ABC-2 type transport system ATP-binding protein